jgi:large repetitive protein
MNLRSTPPLRSPPARRLALLAGLALVLLLLGSTSENAAAGLSDYSSTLYLSGAASSIPGASNKLVTSAGPGQPSTAPTLALGSACSSCLAGSYSYQYTVVDATGGETAPSPASLNLSATNQSIVVSGLPAGVTWRLYRKIPGVLVYKRVAESSGTTWTDSMPDASAGPVLPQSQNRPVTSTGTGYYEFAPGVAMASSGLTSGVGAATPAFSGHGWLVDAQGKASIASGTWTFTTKLTNANGALGGTAHLVIGMWKVNDSGGVVGSAIIDPTSGGENTTANIATGAGTASAITTTINGVPAISLLSTEHLYVQFWRRQTVAATSGTTTTTLNVYDGIARITHPTAGFPDAPTLGSLAARVKTAPALSAKFTDPNTADTGTLTFQVCSDNACATVLPAYSGSSSSGIANGASGTFTPSSLPPDGTYYWRASATDSEGSVSDPSSIDSFVVDTTLPSTAALVSPAAGARATQLSATFSDPDTNGDSGTLNFQLCSNAACTGPGDPQFSGSSTAVANGSNGTWTPTGVPDGTYYWRAQAQDAAGNQSSSWSATRSVILDRTAPSDPTLGSVAPLVNAMPQLSATFSDPDTNGDTGTLLFEICSDSSCSTVVPAGSNPFPSGIANGATGNWTPSGLLDGTYYWGVRSQDAAGNQSIHWTVSPSSFQIDTTHPSAPALGPVAARTATTPQLSATFSDPDAADTGTLSLQLCSNSSCTSVLQSASSPSGVANNASWSWTPTHLADGTYYWRALAQDAAGNQSLWSTGSFVVDTVAPNTPSLASPASASRVNSTQVSATFTDPDAGDSGTLSFELCSDSACTAVVASATSATVSGGTTTSWTPAGIVDGAYYWRARATDAAGNLSGWSATRSLTLDTVAPATPALASPADGVDVNAAPTLSATFSDPDAGDTGSLDFQVCSDNACATVVQSGSSTSGLANGASGSWKPSGLAGGAYYWRARTVDAAGNQSAWSGARGFAFDTTPPAAPALGAIASRINVPPKLWAAFSDPDAADTGSLSLQLCADSGCATVLQRAWSSSTIANGGDWSWTPGNLSDGVYYWRASATDAAGNQSGWSAPNSFIVDHAIPVPTPAALPHGRVATAPLLSARINDPSDPTDAAQIVVQVCADAGCAQIVASGVSSTVPAGALASWQVPALPDGVYYWRAYADDLIDNRSGWSAPQSFVIDTTPPSIPARGAPGDGALVNSPRLTGTFAGDPSESGTLEFDVCADADCTTVVASGSSTSVGAGATAAWTADDLADGSYFWRARAVDEAGNASDWSQAQSFTLDQTPPGRPRQLSAKLAGLVLSLTWRAPRSSTAVVGYELLINGRRARLLPAKARSVHLKVRRNDTRTFAIAAVDKAGNVGAPTVVFGADLVRRSLKETTAPSRRR